jgi:subtilisin-like proprotein convertase family protein
VAVDSAHLYWAHSGLDAPDTVNDGIGRADLDGTNVVHTFIAASEPRGIAVDTARQAVPPSRIAIGDVRQSEGDAGQTAFQFPLTLDSPQPSPVTVGFATADDVATAPGDYAATAGTVTFDPGETAKTATVQVNGDTAVEPDETFAVNLSDAGANGTIADGRAVGTIVNDDPSGTPGTLPGPTGCSAMNGSDVQIPDLATVESPLRISGCAGNASAAATVEVHIVHTFIGDLIVSLVAPDGSSYILHNRAGGATRDINQTYTVNLSSEPADGTWRLRVQDAAPGDVGRIDSWSVNLTGIPTPTPSPTPSPSPTPTPPPAPSPAPSPTPPGCSATNGSDVQIPDLATVESPIGISSCTRSASATATVEVHIVHTFIGDLVVSLVAPDGTTYVLQNRTGFNAHDINQSYIVNLSSEQGEGTWRLRVQDAAAGDVGHIDAWTLSL